MDILEQLLERLGDLQQPTLWDAEDIARYLKLAKSTVQSHVLCKPDFPKHKTVENRVRLWEPEVVKFWVLQQRDLDTESEFLDRIFFCEDFLLKKFANSQKNGRGCIEYLGTVNEWGYGRVTLCTPYKPRKQKVYLHRAAFAYHRKQDPGDFFVCHKCDNPSCINPDHLFLGDPALNMKDMAMKGRGRKPEAFYGR